MSNGKFDVTVSLDSARQRLDALQEGIRPAIRDSVNDTAKSARRRLDDKVKETYTIKKSGFDRAVKIRRATNRTLTAHIIGISKRTPLSNFKHRKNTMGRGRYYVPALRKTLTGSGGKGVMVKEKNSSPMKEIVSPDGANAFLLKVKAFRGRDKEGNYVQDEKKTKTGIFQRTKSGKIRQLYGASVSEMINDVDVFGTVRPYIEDDLMNNLDRHIRRRL